MNRIAAPEFRRGGGPLEPLPNLPHILAAPEYGGEGSASMVTRVATVAFEGIEARAVDVQIQIIPGSVVFTIVGLPDKAVAESRERVRGALIASGLALPAKRITVNLAPADLPKDGGRFDVAIALGILAASGQLPAVALENVEFLGELALSGAIRPVHGLGGPSITMFVSRLT